MNLAKPGIFLKVQGSVKVDDEAKTLEFLKGCYSILQDDGSIELNLASTAEVLLSHAKMVGFTNVKFEANGNLSAGKPNFSSGPKKIRRKPKQEEKVVEAPVDATASANPWANL